MKIERIHFDTIDSTNSWAKSHAATLDPEVLTCITASEQTAGRGRLQRSWVSPPSGNIYATLYFCLPEATPYLANLGELLSLSCATVLKQKGFLVQIKWPNDLLLEEKKFAGILTEVISLENRLGVALGIGLNVNSSPQVDQPTTSLAKASGRAWPVEEVLSALLQQFTHDLPILQEKGFVAFYQQYNAFLAFKGKQIACWEDKQRYKGLCLGVMPDGKLLLELPSGQRLALVNAEL